MKKIIFILVLLVILLSGSVGYLLVSKSPHLSTSVNKLINNVNAQIKEIKYIKTGTLNNYSPPTLVPTTQTKPTGTIGNWSLSAAKILKNFYFLCFL